MNLIGGFIPNGTKIKYSCTSNKSRALRTTKVTEVRIIRYADDFKLFCRDRASAEKMFKLVKIFLKDRLKLEISEKKSKIVNLRKEYSNFLGFRFKAVIKRKRHIARSYISEKANQSIRQLIKKEIKDLQKRRTARQALKFNSVILGIQNYYSMATMVNRDLSKIGYIVDKSLTSRIGNPATKKDSKYKLRYKGYNLKVWSIVEVTLFSLQACKHRRPKLFSAKSNIRIEKEQTGVRETDDSRLRAILRFKRNSVCEVTGEYIKNEDNVYVHWITPKEHGGTDDISNLMLLKSSFKILLKDENRSNYYKNNENYQNILKTLSKYK